MAETNSNHDDPTVIVARGRLAEARKWFDHLGWAVLPNNDRGRKILRWGADHAYLAASINPTRSVRRWCRKYAPWLTEAELAALASGTAKSNKRWSPDQCAVVLGVSLSDHQALGFWRVGASDDADYEVRREMKRKAGAERSRRYRAQKSTGAKRGRPKSEGVPPWKAAGFGSKRSYYRHKALGTAAPQSGTKNASRDISKNRERDGISVPRPDHGQANPKKSIVGINGAPAAPFGSASDDVTDIDTVADAIDYLVSRGLKASEAAELVALIPMVGAQPDHARAEARPKPTPDSELVSYRSRMKPGWRPTADGIKFAKECAYDNLQIANMVEIFRNQHIAIRSYSPDWGEWWKSFVEKRVQADTAAYHERLRDERRAWGRRTFGS